MPSTGNQVINKCLHCDMGRPFRIKEKNFWKLHSVYPVICEHCNGLGYTIEEKHPVYKCPECGAIDISCDCTVESKPLD